MLPSMPTLFSASRDPDEFADDVKLLNENNQLSQKEKLFSSIPLQSELQGFSFESIPEDERECDDELVLLAENSSVGEKRKIPSQNTPTRKKKKIEAVEPLLEDRVNNDEQANHFAASYLMKAKAELDEPTFLKLIALLSNVEENKTNVVSLFNEIMELFSNYPDLAEEFIGFLYPHQAFEVEKFNNYIQFERSWNFFRKIDAFHLNKVFHLLEQHLSNPSVTSETVKNSLLSTFKGHPNISEGLLFLLPDEKPPASCKEDFEDISELGMDDTSMWERLSIPEQSGGGCAPDLCDCLCHLTIPKKFCTFCNIKFLNGQIYVQTGKGLRFAKVTFHGLQQEDVLWHLNPAIYSKPVERKRTKSLSHQSKESSHSVESPSKSEVVTQVSKDSDGSKDADQIENDPLAIEGLVDDGAVDLLLPAVHNEEIACPDEEIVTFGEISDNQMCVVLTNDEVRSQENSVLLEGKEKNTTGGEINEKDDTNEIIKLESSNGPVKMEEIDEQTYESSCDHICADGQGEVEVMENSYQNSEEQKENKDKTEEERESNTRVWTREEDKLILQAFQKQLVTEQTFSRIGDLMPNRTVDDIQRRFQVLMNLLEKMTSGSNYPC